MTPALLPLQALTPQMLVDAVPQVPLHEARKVVAMVYRDEPVRASSALSSHTASHVLAAGHVPTLDVVSEHHSQLDPFRKYVLKTGDGALLETVRIPLEKPGRFSVCVSSQVGCALACSFCATGRMGLVRNLDAWEILEQVRVVHRGLKSEGAGRVHGVVFQGMGEPMANLDKVLTAIRVLSDPCGLAVDQRGITVSTAGIPAGMLRLAREAPKVRLALSLHSARPAVRRSIMPIQQAHSFDDVMDAAVEHARITNLSPMWSITPLLGVNDSMEDADAMAELARTFVTRTGKWPRISIIPYNRIADDASDPFRRITDDGEERFRRAMSKVGVGTHKRYSGGHDVGAACGQLVTASSRKSLAR